MDSDPDSDEIIYMFGFGSKSSFVQSLIISSVPIPKLTLKPDPDEII
jgi:hypothetical protein